MKLTVNDKAGFVEPKTGLTQGVIKSIVTVGTSEGKYGKKNEVVITLALPKQHHTYEEAKGPEMLTISKWFTLSMNKKSNLRAFVEGILGEMKDDSEFELMDLLGTNLMVHITERTKDDGTKTTNVGAVSPLMDEIEAVVVETSKFDFDDYNQAEFEALGEKMQERIKKSDEWSLGPFN